MRALILSVVILGLLAACGRATYSLQDFGKANIGPAERAVVTANPLLQPPTLDLPAPTPGQGNRANPR